MNTIGESLSYLARSNEEEDWDNEDDDEDADLGKLSDDDQPGWVMDTMFKIVLHRIDRFRQKQLRHEKLTQQGWGDAADWFRNWDMKYWTAELKTAAVVKPHTDTTTAKPSPTILAEFMQTNAHAAWDRK